MNKKLFKPGDIVVCISSPNYEMYVDHSVDQLEYGGVYMFQDYKVQENEFKHDRLLYLKKWDGFSGNKHQNNGNCGFLQSRFILRSSITSKELVFMKVKHKLGIKK